MEQSARDKFFERIEAAPLAAQGFFESVDEHFRPRNDVNVRFTHTNVADMRLWAISETGWRRCAPTAALIFAC